MRSRGVATVQKADRKGRVETAAPRHLVQFYEDDHFLVEEVGDYLAAGLARGQPLIAIATPEHRAAFASRLFDRGFDVARAQRSRQLRLVDARTLMAQFITDGWVDPERSEAVLSAVIEEAARFNPRVPVCAYGEMVDLFCADGRPDAALELERIWNALARSHALSLLCGYHLARFPTAADGATFLHVCHAHTDVIPSEKYATLRDPNARLREISSLQQRARALEREVAEHEATESALREAIQQRDDFLSVAGHELRTPLTAVQLHLGMLASATEHDPKLKGRVERVARGVDRLTRLVDQLLDVSRLSAGGLTLDREPLDLAELVRFVTDGFEAEAEAARCPLTVNAPTPVIGHWDRSRLEQVVVNLLTNALKYGRGAPIAVTVEPTPGGARLTVRDGGIGIPPADHARVFDRFERASPAHHYGGLGLGLFITRQIVEAHGGSIGVTSAPGEGATFTVYFPA